MKNTWSYISVVLGFIVLLICLLNITIYFGDVDSLNFNPKGFSFKIINSFSEINLIFLITLSLLSCATIYYNIKYIVSKENNRIAKFITKLMLFICVIPFIITIIGFIV